MRSPKQIGVKVFIGLGSNLGDREKRILSALDWLEKHSRMDVLSCTKIEETDPWGFEDQPMFLNAIAEIETDLLPHELLTELKKAEMQLGRKKNHQKWGPREIDLDILLYGDEIVDSPELTIPHPHLLERSFLVNHLLELDPELVHPVMKRRLATYLAK